MNTFEASEIYGRDGQREKLANQELHSGNFRIVMHRDDDVSFLEAYQAKDTKKSVRHNYILIEMTDEMLTNLRDKLNEEFPARVRRCAECISWNKLQPGDRVGDCANDELQVNTTTEDMHDDQLIAYVGNPVLADLGGVCTGPDFCCSHFERRVI